MSAPSSRSEALAPFDVVVVPYPYSDKLAEKRRPAVVISTRELQRRYGLVWLVMITSAENPRWPCDVEISDLRGAGLPAPSLLRPARIATAHAARVIRRIGHLSRKDAGPLVEQFNALLAR